ncbi:MAG: hypothetical protein ABI921_11475 [Panacibacter sp.]
MTQIFLIIISALLSFNSFSQEFINFKKQEVRKILTKYTTDNNYKTILEETDSSFSFLVRDTAVRPIEVLFLFDKSGKCNYVKKTADCDSCIQKYIQETLNNKTLKWTRINENNFVSRFSKKISLEIIQNVEVHSFVLKRQDWKRKEYKNLLPKR